MEEEKEEEEEDARNKGKDVTGLGIFLHKHVRDWRMATMRNWVVNQVTRPEMDNSMISFRKSLIKNI